MEKSRKKIVSGVFLQYLYTHSSLSPTTQRIYMRWVTKCCQYAQVQHPLDLAPQDLEAFRLYLLHGRHFSPSSDTIVYNAFKHTFVMLLSQVLPDEATRYAYLFHTPPRQPHHLPRTVSRDLVERFLAALPQTPVGVILKTMYATSQPFEMAKQGWKCSKAYASSVCAKTARTAGIPHGFGLTGLRGISIIHRIQARTDDADLATIFQDSGLSPAQFALYRRVAAPRNKNFLLEETICSI